jgi:hypothetical protein
MSYQENRSSASQRTSEDEMSDMLSAANVTLDESLENTPWAINARKRNKATAYSA